MPRVTRAALRSIEQQEGSDIAATIPLPETPVNDRVPLGEITGNKGAQSEAANTPEEQAAPVKKGTGKGKKGKAAKNANKKTKDNAEGVHVEVLEDESNSIHSSAAEEACHDLIKDGSQEPTGTTQVILDNDQPQTPPSAAANAASRQLSPKTTTPCLVPEMHKPDKRMTSDGKDEQEDSFVAKIESRTPLRMTNSEKIEMPLKGESGKDDSFVEQIKARTPGKRISRIEDSVEALDALEEEIEKVGGLIPARKQAKPQSTITASKFKGSMRTKNSDGHLKKVEFKRSSTATRPSAEAPNPRARPRAEQKPDTATQAAGSPLSTDQATSQAMLKKRVSSVHKAPFQPMKSTKAPTRPNFELPGDAVARKLKEKREERSKHEVDEVAKPRVFKARPVRLSHAPEVKLTAATKARLSMAKGERIGRTGLSNGVDDKSKPVARPSPMATASPNKRLSTLSIGTRSTRPTASGSTLPSTHSSARLTRGPSLDVSTTIRAPSVLGVNRPAPTAEESAQQKLKGKEVFGRTRAEIVEREKAKREKEDAARKARADAAERGRIASRAWAEKQKARKLEAGNVSEQGKAGGV